MSKHTKGPWEARADWIVGFNGTLHIATIPRAFDGDYSEANALLIAAAPDLLAACKAVMNNANHIDCDAEKKRYIIGQKEFELIDAALAKAEGVKP